jgi:hypothetical protein
VKSVVPSVFTKTNPISKSITSYKERTNPKNRKTKENPNEPKLFGFVSVIPAQAGIQTSSCQQKNKKSKSCLSCLKYLCVICEICGSVCFQKRTQFFHDKICVISIKNPEMEAKKLGKKTKQTQLWITSPVR